jgi:2-iminobutanoate/2-iminopropanoate deaminase
MTRTTTTIRARSALVTAGLAGLIVGILVGAAAFQQSAVAQQSNSGRRAIHPEKSPNTGLPYSPGILVGNTLYVSGNLGRDPVSAKLVQGGIEAETRQSLANIRETLKAAGMDFKDVVSVTAYIANFNDFEKFNAVYREYFPTDPPARATVQVAALNIGAKIELQMIAVKP